MRKLLMFKFLLAIAVVMVLVCDYYMVGCRKKEHDIPVDTVDILTEYVEALRPQLGVCPSNN